MQLEKEILMNNLFKHHMLVLYTEIIMQIINGGDIDEYDKKQRYHLSDIFRSWHYQHIA